MFHIPDGKFNYFQGSTMTNALLSGFIDLLKTASHVQLMLPGLTTLSTAEIEETDSSITQVRLLWGQNCETLLSPAVIAAGQWDGDTFNCSDNYGRPVKLQMLAMTTLKPAAATSSELDRLLRDVLVEGSADKSRKARPCAMRCRSLSGKVQVRCGGCCSRRCWKRSPISRTLSSMRSYRGVGLGLDAATA